MLITYDFKKDFDFYSICNMINLLPRTVGMDNEIDFYRDKKKYTITKTDNKIVLSCSDGRELTIIAKNGGKMRNQNGESNYVNISCNYRISDNSTLSMFKSLPDCVIEDIEGLEPYKLSKDNSIRFVVSTEKGQGHSFKLFSGDYIDDICTMNGEIKYKNFIISSDFTKISSKEGFVPSKETLENFDIEKAKKELFISLNTKYETNSYMTEYLLSKFNEEEFLNYNKELLLLYEMLPSIKEAIKFRSEIRSNKIGKYVFSEEEMAMFDDVLMNSYEGKLPKTDEEIIGESIGEIVGTLYNGAVESIEEVKKFVKKTFGL